MKYAPCSVLVVRQTSRTTKSGGSGSPLRVVLAYDDSKPAERAVQFLASLPRQDRVEVLVVTVQVLITTFRMDLKQKQAPLWREQQLKANADLERVASELQSLTPHVTSQLLEGSDASEEILNVAGDFDADVIVLGATGHAGIERFLLGSVANRVLHHAHCSVLVARG
ncbi:MAG: universal stress protein [Planctomycetota bacterium]|nr:universal stress protein [Planctomycetota bacterium]